MRICSPSNSVLMVVFLLIGATNLLAHEGGHHSLPNTSQSSSAGSIGTDEIYLSGAEQSWFLNRIAQIQQHDQLQLSFVALNRPTQDTDITDADNHSLPEIGKHFLPFEKLLQLRSDEKYLYVGSNGLPEHPMMIGIRSWQQQVPIPQKYLGNNAWRIPLHPVPAANPMTTKNDFLRGAIALAVNGVPIFNPLNNRGDDAFLFGELDEYGGHCGRGDDYHYHIAPVHLEKTLGKDKPIAYALDGYPILGYQDRDSADYAALDKLGGHKDAAGNYHYHAQEKYPYLNGGFYGEVTKRGGQIDPQPRAEPVRPDLRPLKDAKITGFKKTGNRFELEYEVAGKKGTVAYVIKDDGVFDFTFKEPSGKSRFESFKSRMGKPFLPQADTPQTEKEAESTTENSHSAAAKSSELTVTSSAFFAEHELPIEFTGDGLGQSPPISWTKGPAETKSYAVNLWHIPESGETKSYWLLYDIPADVTSLPQNVKGIGTAGHNDKLEPDYDPMKSKGPGVKQYHITVYALSEKLNLPSEKVTRDELLESISSITLAKGTLDFQYTRSENRWWILFLVAGSALLVAVGIWRNYR